MHNIVIYRHQLFKPSETFIFQQTKYLEQYTPIFAGRSVDGDIPKHAKIRLIKPAGFSGLVRHLIFRDQEILLEQLTRDKPDLVHAHFGVEGVYALPLAKKLQVPLITTFHGFDATCTRTALLTSKKISWLNYLVHRRALSREGDHFIVVSDFIKKRVIELGFPEEKTHTHYIGVDTEAIKPSGRKKPDTKIILHVARLVEVKGTISLLRAFAILQEKKVDAKLVVIGEGHLFQSLQALAQSLGIQNSVQFLGTQPHHVVIHWMQQSSVFCLPSAKAENGQSEAFGMVLLEASSCQIPIVATQHGGIPEAVIDGQTGYLVPERDPDALAERLKYLLENESMSTKLGVTGRHFVEQHFDLRRQTNKLEQLYYRVGK